jgi:hypothetical protein
MNKKNAFLFQSVFYRFALSIYSVVICVSATSLACSNDSSTNKKEEGVMGAGRSGSKVASGRGGNTAIKIRTSAGEGAAGAGGGSGSGPIQSGAKICDGKAADEMVCDGKILYRCDGKNGVAESDVCDSKALCQAGTHGTSCGQCEPDSYTCEGLTLQKCDESGQYSAVTGKKFENVAECQKELKNPSGACKLGQFKCVKDVVYKCNDSQTEFIKDTNIKDACKPGLCNADLGKCNVCAPGMAVCNDKGDGIITCSADGQKTDETACGKDSPICYKGVCGQCKEDSDPSKTGCPNGSECTLTGNSRVCNSKSNPNSGSPAGLWVAQCKPGICKVVLLAGYKLNFTGDYTKCTGAGTDGAVIAVRPYPQNVSNLLSPGEPIDNCVITGHNGETAGCAVNPSSESRELAVEGPFETGCNYFTSVGCKSCVLTDRSDEGKADFGFNSNFDTQCQCPLLHMEAVAAQ